MKARFLIPLALFFALLGLFYFALQQMNAGEYNPRDIPSPLVGKPVPVFSLPSLKVADAQVTNADLTAPGVSLFNVWASWCVACRQEHPFLMELSRRGEIPIFGLNYKDERDDAIAWLKRFGDPYTASGYDREGRVGIDWGVYGVPETFVVDRNGTIRYKHIGPVTEKAWREKILPVIEQVRGEL